MTAGMTALAERNPVFAALTQLVSTLFYPGCDSPAHACRFDGTGLQDEKFVSVASYR